MSENRLTVKHYLPYVFLIAILGVGIWLILATGSRLYTSPTGPASPSAAAASAESDSNYVLRIFRENLKNPVSILLLQLVVIIATTRVVGQLFKKIGQPPVLGEIVAGIILGPSLLGWFWPETMLFLFRPASMETLKLLSQIGVALFMFLVGMELDVDHLRQRAHAAVMVSHASIILPFFLGVALALVLYPTLAPATTTFVAFALFIGIAMSITAFPVLARILEDRQMTQTQLGSIALTCAAVDDVTAWCLLALVIAVAQSGSVSASFLTIGLTLVFIGFMLLVVKPQLNRMFSAFLTVRPDPTKSSRGLIAGVLVLVFLSALVTETIGIHALFGAFLAGVVMPSTAGLRVLLKDKLETFSSALLPLFFAFTGLRMQLSLLNDWQSWAICFAIIGVAITGKLVASMLMARWTGMGWRDSFALGALMNTRGLVELIVLNIGYDLGILSGRLFAMLVLMALVTTFMTGPLLALVRTPEPARPAG